jgi:hypothetical protein
MFYKGFDVTDRSHVLYGGVAAWWTRQVTTFRRAMGTKGLHGRRGNSSLTTINGFGSPWPRADIAVAVGRIVAVNGTLVLDQGRHNGAAPGRAVRHRR